MQPLSSLTLPHLALEEPALAQNPYPHFEAARAQHPWLAKSAFGYVVSEYEATKDLMWLDDKMRTAHDAIADILNAQGTPWGRFIQEQILGRSGPSHKQLRDIVAPMFTPRNANKTRPLMRAVVSKLLDEWAPKGAFDFEEFASNFPITVMCGLVGAPPEAIPSIRSYLEALGLAFSMDPKYQPRVQDGMVQLDKFCEQIVAARRAKGRTGDDSDVLELLIIAQDNGQLTARELTDLLVFIFVAGYDTSKNVLTLMMYTMLNHPAAYSRCAEDVAFCGKVAEETMRLHNPALISRLTTDDVTYRDVQIPKGTMLMFPVSIIGRDPAAFPEPDKFDPERPNANRHLAFGRGMHMCLGQFIARAQIEEGWHLIAQRITKPKLAGEIGWRPFPGVWGIRGLPITFTPAPARAS